MGFDIGSIANTATGGVVGQVLGMALGGMQDQRQYNQQEKLQNLQIKGNKEMGEFNKEQQLDIWNKTNYEAQKEHMQNAGLNPGLMYGMGGGGGTTTGSPGGTVSGGTASDGSARMQASAATTAQMGLMTAQKDVLESQADKNKAETEKISGADTRETTARATNTEFQNELNKSITISKMAENYNWANDKLATESQKQMAEWEAYKAGGFEGKSTDDPTSEVAKAIKAGLQNTVQQLQNAKTENNVKKAEQIVKEFEASMAKQGIAPNSPWQVKIIADILGKLGLNPLK